MQVYSLLAQPMVFKEVVEHADDGVGALPHVDSFIDDICRGMDSQHTPKIAHFLGVRKYMGPGWRGLLGQNICCAMSKL